MSQTILPSGILLSNATIPAGQTDQVPDSSSIIVTGTLTNDGTLFSDSINYATVINFGDSSGTVDTLLTGAGIVLLSDSDGNGLSADRSG